METAIGTFGLTKYYGPQRGIEDLDIQVHRGEIFGLLGPNGAGKTTTMRLLLGLLTPTRGRVEIFGLDARRDSLEVRRRTGYVPGEAAFFESMKGRRWATPAVSRTCPSSTIWNCCRSCSTGRPTGAGWPCC